MKINMSRTDCRISGQICHLTISVELQSLRCIIRVFTEYMCSVHPTLLYV
jgi:hypothetical protein